MAPKGHLLLLTRNIYLTKQLIYKCTIEVYTQQYSIETIVSIQKAFFLAFQMVQVK